jgi:hypothetical protein
VKGCALFAALFVLGLGTVAGGMVYDVIYGGIELQDPRPGPQPDYARERDVARKLEVGGVALTFVAIFGAAGWGFYRRQRDPEREPSDPR